MTDADVQFVIRHTRGLFPRNNWQPAEWQLLIDDLRRRPDISAEQAAAVVSECRRNANTRNPPLKEIHKRLAKIHETQQRAERAGGWKPEPDDDGGPFVPTTLAAFLAWAESQPAHPVSGHATNPVYQAALKKHGKGRA